jgi:hypothetical protein
LLLLLHHAALLRFLAFLVFLLAAMAVLPLAHMPTGKGFLTRTSFCHVPRPFRYIQTRSRVHLTALTTVSCRNRRRKNKPGFAGSALFLSKSGQKPRQIPAFISVWQG